MLRLSRETTSEAVALLESLIGILSENPPGEEDRIIAFIEGYLDGHGIDSTRVALEPGRSSLVARLPGTCRGSIVLCGHVDTVRSESEKWMHPPLEPRIERGRISGLGAADMKGGVAAILQVAKELRTQGSALTHDVVLAFTADEERAYRGAASIAKSGLVDDAKILVIAEPTAGKVYIGQKGELWVRATFRGREAHGSMPDHGINAILPAAEFCTRVQSSMSDYPFVPGCGRTSLNVGEFHGGRQINIVPDEASVSLDIRLATPGDRKRVLDSVDDMGRSIAERTGASFSVEILNDKAPIISDAENSLVSRFLHVAAEVSNSNIERAIVGYSTDAVEFIPVLDVPVVVYGPGDIKQAHRQDEFLEIESLTEAIEVFVRFIESVEEQYQYRLAKADAEHR